MRPFAEFVEENRIRCKLSLPDFYRRAEKLQASGRISKRGRRAIDPLRT
jgi:hypothetical protein